MSWTKLKEMAQLREDRRRAKRELVDLVTMATRNGKEKLSVRLVDISPLGLHCKTSTPFERGEQLRIMLPIVGEVQIEIAWSLKGCFGGWFIEPISPTDYPAILGTVQAKQRGPQEA